MRRFILSLIFTLSIGSVSAMVRAGVDVGPEPYGPGGGVYYDTWYGPGYYYGVYYSDYPSYYAWRRQYYYGGPYYWRYRYYPEHHRYYRHHRKH